MPLQGRALRFVLVDEIRRYGTVTVAEMVEVLAAHGYTVVGRASKVISDGLRWELARGRVERVARGVYRYAGAPASTIRRVRLFAAACHAWIAAVLSGQEPPPTPLDQRAYPWRALEDPARPPWRNTHWLWTA